MNSHLTHKTQRTLLTLLTFFVYLSWALVLTYPLTLHPLSHIPLGSEPVGTVPLFNLWTLQWNIDQLMQGYPNYWDAPIFFPNIGTFAFSETQPLTALLATPFWFISPALGYNFVIILFLTINGWFAYWLLRSWGASFLPATLAGLLMQSLPFAAQEMGVLQLVAIFGLLWSLFFLSRFLKGPNRRNIVGLALGTPVTFLTCGYYGLISVFMLPFAFATQLQKKHLKLKTLFQFLIVLLLIVALGSPFLLAQRELLNHYNFTRSTKIVEANSARIQHYFNVMDYNVFYSRWLEWQSGQGQRLFPGVIVFFLAGLGIFGGSHKRIKMYLAAAIILGFLLSLGLRLNISGFQPYQWVRDYLPGFSQLRSPFRFAVVVQIHLVLLAGFGLFNLHQWRPQYGTLLAVGLTSLTLLESIAMPVPLQPIPAPSATPQWQVWLNQHNETPRVVMLPFAQSTKVADFEQTVLWMLENRYFQAQMVNGYSGFFPPGHARLREHMLQFPTVDGLNLLRDMQVDYVVIHHSLANAPPARKVEITIPLIFEDSQASVSIYTLSPNK